MVIKYKYNPKTKNIKILNSYLYENKKEMIKYLDQMPLYKINRNIKSCLNEWIAHKRLYQLGLFKEHTKDCDLSANESVFRRICYWFLSRFY